MHEAPSRKALIETALESFQAEILPDLAGDRKYLGLMIASALAMAVRELETDGDGSAARRVLDAFAALYGEDNVARAGADMEARIDELCRDLSRELRDGLYDADLTGPVIEVLTVLTEEKLKLSNPKFLAAREYSQPTPN
ncbi:DUF6285 domain-containing protein [Nisaea acidiphila]|uniref:DUF6285 domain-containing protein n=1 Tax=Nisaea acidiphila TaxID=1862145 RepID=A0A9J7AYD3_9PROT|nr:DUF6285 domain-containing protein [Nisaea acidiphila]UUX50445.1 DUF6285 domain-containing protein [Nisaea acidiphila]